MSRAITVPLVALCLCLSTPALGQAQDPERAKEELKQGYELKTQGRYKEALDHLLESLRLDSQLKTLLNVADCEEQLSKFVDARSHWILARDNAKFQGNQAFAEEAALRLNALEARMPRLVITLGPGAPAGTQVIKDGSVLGAVSLGTPLPSDPGKHVIVARAPGHADQTFEVNLAEREQYHLSVAPGGSTGTGFAGVTTSPGAEPVQENPNKRRDIQHIIALSTASVGVVALGVATVSWLKAASTHDDAREKCNSSGCSAEARELQDDALSSARFGNIAAAVGGLLIAGGGVLWFTAPDAKTEKAHGVRFAPVLGSRFNGVAATGQF